MKLIPITLVTLGTLGGILFLTNPKPETYNEFAADQLAATLEADVCKVETLGTWLGKIGQGLGEACELAVRSGRSLGADEIQTVIEESTEHQNYQLFSVYETETPVKTVKFVGIFNRFIPLKV